jgi:hypothetical protein
LGKQITAIVLIGVKPVRIKNEPVCLRSTCVSFIVTMVFSDEPEFFFLWFN